MALDTFRVELGLDIQNITDGISTQVYNGIADPTSGGGVVADIGSIYQRSDGTIYAKTGAGNTAWSSISGGGSSVEEGYIRTYIGKPSAGSVLPVYSSVIHIGQGNNLTQAIGDLDNYLGAFPTPVTRTQNPIDTSADVNVNISNLDTAIGADAQLTPQVRIDNPVTLANTVYQNLDALDAAIGATPTSLNYIANNVSVNANLSTLDSKLKRVKNYVAVPNVGAATSVDTVLVDNVSTAKWFVECTEVATPANKHAVEIYAVHDGTAVADATSVDWTTYAKIKTASIPGLSFSVVLTGAGGAQTMDVVVTSVANPVNVKVIRLDIAEL